MKANPTAAEALLWEQLKGKRLGVKFRRQHIIDQFIVDFYCLEKGVVVEVDGQVHQAHVESDYQRELHLIKLGCSVLRFSNEAIETDMGTVVATIRMHLKNNTN
jgi:very-short-patch-repair endonuclease